MSTPVRPIRTRRLYETVAEHLSQAIAEGTYPIGTRLPPERELAERFNVGRPTIREALIALELAGLIDVRTGSGVYVLHNKPRQGASFELDIGPFELVEARSMVEGETAALAAELASPEQMAAIRTAFDEMVREDESPGGGEDADREFHVAIARATRNSALVFVVEQLWSVRDSSPLTARLHERLRERGVRPRIEEHRAVLDAIARRDPAAAREAMRSHLSRVLGDLLEATEVEEVEAARARVRSQRERYARSLGGTGRR